jgi:hypothetical protein
MKAYKVLVEWKLTGQTAVVGEKTVPVPLSLPQISHRLQYVKDRTKTLSFESSSWLDLKSDDKGTKLDIRCLFFRQDYNTQYPLPGLAKIQFILRAMPSDPQFVLCSLTTLNVKPCT